MNSIEQDEDFIDIKVIMKKRLIGHDVGFKQRSMSDYILQIN